LYTIHLDEKICTCKLMWPVNDEQGICMASMDVYGTYGSLFHSMNGKVEMLFFHALVNYKHQTIAWVPCKILNQARLFQHCSKHCSNNVPTLFRQCSNNVPTLIQDCSNIVPTLFQDCSNTVTTLFQPCYNPVPTLFQQCSNIVPTLFQDYYNPVPTLFLHCSNTVTRLFQE
jgi:hypothetical protein